MRIQLANANLQQVIESSSIGVEKSNISLGLVAKVILASIQCVILCQNRAKCGFCTFGTIQTKEQLFLQKTDVLFHGINCSNGKTNIPTYGSTEILPVTPSIIEKEII